MLKVLWGAVGACVTASISTEFWSRRVLLLTLAFLFVLIAGAGPVAHSFNAQVAGRRRHMIFLGIAIAGGIACWVGASLGYHYYDQEKKERAAEQKRLDDLRGELAEQRRRADAAVALEGRRLAKYQVVNGRIADAINSAGTIRYALETTMNAARAASGSLQAFDQGFDNTDHARAVETWRATTSRMLDDELPTARLGASLNEVEGERVGSRSVYALSRIMACTTTLRGMQRDLRSHVELAVQ